MKNIIFLEFKILGQKKIVCHIGCRKKGCLRERDLWRKKCVPTKLIPMKEKMGKIGKKLRGEEGARVGQESYLDGGQYGSK